MRNRYPLFIGIIMDKGALRGTIEIPIEISLDTLRHIFSSQYHAETGKQCTLDDIPHDELVSYLKEAITRAVEDNRYNDENFDIGLHDLAAARGFFWCIIENEQPFAEVEVREGVWSVIPLQEAIEKKLWPDWDWKKS